MNWTVTLEREVLPNWNVQASYHGVANRQLLYEQNINSVQASATPYNPPTCHFLALAPSTWFRMAATVGTTVLS